ncbi:hypothetical protein ABT215_18025 [Streptomyces sp900105755]|uniref:hypothetical protein n=1 Tax=Streptomyces sp. 900105755 TaxID=3154389 RepID=UPI00332711E9
MDTQRAGQALSDSALAGPADQRNALLARHLPGDGSEEAAESRAPEPAPRGSRPDLFAGGPRDALYTREHRARRHHIRRPLPDRPATRPAGQEAAGPENGTSRGGTWDELETRDPGTAREIIRLVTRQLTVWEHPYAAETPAELTQRITHAYNGMHHTFKQDPVRRRAGQIITELTGARLRGGAKESVPLEQYMPVFQEWHRETGQPLANMAKGEKYQFRGVTYDIGLAMYQIQTGRREVNPELMGQLKRMDISLHTEATYVRAAGAEFHRTGWDLSTVKADYIVPNPDARGGHWNEAYFEYHKNIALGEYLAKVANRTWNVTGGGLRKLVMWGLRPEVPLSPWWPKVVRHMENHRYLSTRDVPSDLRSLLTNIRSGHAFVDPATRDGLAGYGWFVHSWRNFADALNLYLGGGGTLGQLTEQHIVEIQTPASSKQPYLGRVELKRGLDYIMQNPGQVAVEDPKAWVALNERGLFGRATVAIHPVASAHPAAPVAGPSRDVVETGLPDHALEGIGDDAGTGDDFDGLGGRPLMTGTGTGAAEDYMNYAAGLYLRVVGALTAGGHTFLPDTHAFWEQRVQWASLGDEEEVVRLLTAHDWTGHRVETGHERAAATMAVRVRLGSGITRVVADPEIHAALTARARAGDMNPDPRVIVEDITRQHDLAAGMFGAIWQARQEKRLPLPDSRVFLRMVRDGFPDLTDPATYNAVTLRSLNAVENLQTFTLGRAQDVPDLPRRMIETRRELPSRISPSVSDREISGALARSVRLGEGNLSAAAAQHILEQRTLLADLFEQDWNWRATQGFGRLETLAALYTADLGLNDLTRPATRNGILADLALQAGTTQPLPHTGLHNIPCTLILTRYALAAPDLTAPHVFTDADIITAANHTRHPDPDPATLAHHLRNPTRIVGVHNQTPSSHPALGLPHFPAAPDPDIGP